LTPLDSVTHADRRTGPASGSAVDSFTRVDAVDFFYPAMPEITLGSARYGVEVEMKAKDEILYRTPTFAEAAAR